MYKADITLSRETDLHSRNASIFVKEANKYLSDIKIIKNTSEYDGKSILGIISLGASVGDTITIVARGQDEKEAVEALKGLLVKAE